LVFWSVAELLVVPWLDIHASSAVLLVEVLALVEAVVELDWQQHWDFLLPPSSDLLVTSSNPSFESISDRISHILCQFTLSHG
jgi:hypothetical protein